MKKKTTLPYRTISLPNNLYVELEKYVGEHEQYVSIANFVRLAIKEKIKQDTFKMADISKFMEQQESKEIKKIARVVEEVLAQKGFK